MHVFLPSESFIGWLLDDVVDAARCAELIGELETRGFDRTGERYPNDYRNNDRLVFDDATLAASLFELLRPRLPAELVVDGVRWALCGLNPRFRACRYRDGQSFTIHRDGPHVPSDELRSHLTVQLYLDDDPARSGGRTRFYADAAGATLWAAVAPRTGSAIVFDHRAWHDGESVNGGIKHVLRTDAMYRRVDTVAVVDAEPPRDEVIGRHRGYAWRAIVCADGSVASAGRDGCVRSWGRRTDSDARCVDLAAGSVTTLVEDGAGRIWCGTRAGAVFVIDGDSVTRVAEDVGAVLGAAAHADGRIAISTSRGTVLLSAPFSIPVPCSLFTISGNGEPRTGNRELEMATTHDGWAWSVRAYRDDFVSCGEDGSVLVHPRDARTRVVAELHRHLRALAVLPNDELLVGDTQGWVHRVTSRGDVHGAIRAHAAAVTDIAIAPDGTWASCSEDGSVKRWRDQRPLATHGGRDFVTSIAFDARNDLICTGYDGAVRLITSSS